MHRAHAQGSRTELAHRARAQGSRTLGPPHRLSKREVPPVGKKLAARAEQAASKLLNKLSVKSQELEKAESAAVPPTEFLKLPQFAAKYSAGSFDASGKPSLDAAGEALSKAATKEVDKLLQKQQKEHEKHLKALEKAPGYIDDIKGEIAARRSDARALLQEEEANLSEELLTKLRLEATR